MCSETRIACNYTLTLLIVCAVRDARARERWRERERESVCVCVRVCCALDEHTRKLIATFWFATIASRFGEIRKPDIEHSSDV